MPAPDRRPIGLSVRSAVSFLTTVPVGGHSDLGASDIGRGAIFFPVVGALLGGAAALVAWAVSLALPVTIAALASVATSALLTGALHLDGLADTADGYGARTRARALAIMQEHSVGAYGVVALILDVGLRTAAISTLLVRPRSLLYLVAAGALSRSVSLGLGALLPHARADGGFAGVLDRTGGGRAAVTIVVGAAIAALSVGGAGAVATVLVAGGAVLWGWHCLRRLGGVTGDTLGAASEGAELIVLVVGAGLR
ncbi:MAG TPA: adenosylcobinamide-GDP ribazoletransferase [Candidatus Limnocylindrales bacterium]|nr:adenosylcobinamide-GDP ribazoletransferase [Candidatus Limnocylindrales bacterium]